MWSSGGAEVIPNNLKKYVRGKAKLVELIRNMSNLFAKIKFRLNGKLENCDELLFANYETQKYLEKLRRHHGKVMTEVGMDDVCVRRKEIESPVKFLVIGRLIYRKGVVFLLDALSRLPQGDSYVLKIVGEGPELSTIQKFIKKKMLENHVKIIKPVPFIEMKKIYMGSDVLILPSLRETTGTVLVEALSYGLPVITINQFGGKVVLDKSVAWFYSGDTKDEILLSLINILHECINDPDLIMKKSNAALEKSKNYTWENKYRKYSELYQSIIKEHDEIFMELR